MSEKLKPCPVCGSEAGITPYKTAYCLNRLCAMHHAVITPDQWNTRAQSQAEVEMREALESAYEFMDTCKFDYDFDHEAFIAVKAILAKYPKGGAT